MWRIWFTRTAALLALALLPPSSQGGVEVFQDPNATIGDPANPAATFPANGTPVVLTLWYNQTGGNASNPGTVCWTGTGDEVCGWDIYVSTSSPSVVLQSFAPAPDVVAAITDNSGTTILRANGGDPINGETSVHKIGTLTVAATAPGTVNVVGNLYVTASLNSANVTTGTLLATATAAALDTDGDTIPDTSDNCPTVANGPDQAAVANVGNQTDSDVDGVGDACDNCVNVENPRVTPNTASYLASNQWATLTGDQRDDDHDGYGNKCDAKFPGVSGAAVGPGDLTQFRTANNKSRTLDNCGTAGNKPCAIFDLDELNTAIGPTDLTQFRALNNKAPGPKCPTCPLACAAGTAGSCAPIP